MRRVVTCAGWIFAVSLPSLGLAVPPPAPTTPRPPPPGSTVRIAKITNLTQPATGGPAGSYRGGPVEIAVELENAGPAAATVTLRVKRAGFVFSRAVTVPPRTSVPTVPVHVTEPGGLGESCSPHTYAMTLEGEGADTRERHASLVPTCSWSGGVEDAWGGQVADAARGKKAVITSVAIATAPTCKTPAKLTVAVANHAEKPAASLAVEARVGDQAQAMSSPIRVAARGKASVTVQVPGGEAPVEPRLWLVDPSGAFAGEIANRPLAVKWRRACRLAVTAVSP